MKKLFYITLAIFACTACTDNENAPSPALNKLTFESSDGWRDIEGAKISLGDVTIVGGVPAGTYSNVFWAKSESYPTSSVEYMGNVYDGILCTSPDGKIRIGSYYLDGTGWGSQMDTWGGFVFSRNFNKTASTLDLKDQFCAWADKGANGTATFLAAYDMSWAGGKYGTPTIEFTTPRTVESIWLANSTTLHAYTSSKADYSFAIRIVGYDAAGAELGSVDCVLADAAGKVADWTKVSLEALGAVSALKFKVVSNDSMAPTYFCVDEITLKK